MCVCNWKLITITLMCDLLVLSYRLTSHTIELSLGKTNSGFNKPHVLVADKNMRPVRMDEKNYGKKSLP